MDSGVGLRCARSILVRTSHYSRLEKPTIPLATQERLTTYIFHVVLITTNTHFRRKSIGKKKQRKENKIKERKEKKSKRKMKGKKRKASEKGKKRNGKTRKARTDETRRGSIFFFTHTYFPASGQSRGHKCHPFFPPGSCLHFLSRIGFSNPTTRRFFIECC